MGKMFSLLSRIPSHLALIRRTGNYYVKELGLSLTIPDQIFFLDGLGYAKKLAGIGMCFHNGNDGIRFDFNGLTGLIFTAEEMYILYEIFHEGIYNLKTNKRLIVLDIGMNVGFASLFFSQLENVKHVYGYEPIKDTFLIAKKNISLNFELSKKITPLNFGVGANASEQIFKYMSRYKGSTGIFGVAPLLKTKEKINPEEIVDRKVEILRASDILTELSIKNPNEQLFIKIDCEGAEYEIVDDIIENANLSNVVAMAIEWHQLGAQRLIDNLIKRNFSCFSFSPHASGVGMLYFFR